MIQTSKTIVCNLGVIKNGGFLKPILTNLIQKKLRKIGDDWKALQKIFHLSRVATHNAIIPLF